MAESNITITKQLADTGQSIIGLSIPIIECPHCQLFVEIVELNCRIFRHGVYKSTGKQINPHAAKSECDKLVAKNLIYGCGKPFKVDITDSKITVSVCDYV